MFHESDEDQPSKVPFRNHQWSVTSLGVEGLGSRAYYVVDEDRLLKTTNYGSGDMYDWPIHMAEKRWVDIEAFIEAFEKALDLHGYSKDVDPARLAESVARARIKARRTAQELDGNSLIASTN